MPPKDFPLLPSAMVNQQYCLKWNNHQVNLLRSFDRLLQSESFTDVTLACEGKSLRAHKVVLSACSSYFESLFEDHPDKSPIIILKDMKFTHVSQLVNFMYRGEINITQDMLSGLLNTAETLKVKGLAEVSSDHNSQQNIPSVAAAAAAAAVAVAQAHAQTSFGINAPSLIPPHTSALTAALNAPISNPPLAPLAALLAPDQPGACDVQSLMPIVPALSSLRFQLPSDPSTNNEPPEVGIDERHPSHNKRKSQDQETAETSPKIVRKEEETKEVQRPITSKINQALSASSIPNIKEECTGIPSDPHGSLTPLPVELSVKSKMLPEFLMDYQVYRLNDYLGFRTRQQFWDESAVRRIMEGIKGKEIDMKSAAEILGVSYGTLYGRYREAFGYLKHSWVNKPSKSGGNTSKEKSIWEEARSQDLIQKVLSKELSLTAAAVRLGVDTNTFFSYLTDNGKDLARVSYLMGNTDQIDNDGELLDDEEFNEEEMDEECGEDEYLEVKSEMNGEVLKDEPEDYEDDPLNLKENSVVDGFQSVTEITPGEEASVH